MVLYPLVTSERTAGPLDKDEALVRASTAKLLDVAEREHMSFVAFGHDGAQRQLLKTAPYWYD